MGKLSKLKGVVDQAVSAVRQTAAERELEDIFRSAQSRGAVAEYSDDLIAPGTGDIRNQIARYNETILGDDFRKSFDNETYYHHTDSDITEFKPERSDGFWFTDQKNPEPGDIGNFGDGIVYPVRLRKGIVHQNGDNYDVDDFLKRNDADSIQNIYEYGEDWALSDPSRIRSVNAAFDPAKKDSANLLASVGGAAVLGGAALSMTPEQAQASTRLSDFAQRRAAKQDHWKQLKNTILEGMAAINRGAVEGLNFIGPDQVNAVMQLAGSDKQIPTFSDIPGVEQATEGNFMEPGAARDVVRTGGEFLSPL